MERQHHPFVSHPINRAALAWTIAWALAVLLASASAHADGARQAQYAKPGEIVVMRNVSARPAYRQPVSPGMALLVDPSPRSQIDSALGIGELSDADASGLGASPPRSQPTVVRVLDSALGNMGGHSGGSTVASNGMSNVVGGSMGAVGNATSGISGQVTGALSQMPTMPVAPAGVGH